MKSVVEDVKAKRDSQIAELKETCEMRIEMADLRRQQTLKEKVDSAKKTVAIYGANHIFINSFSSFVRIQ